MSETVLEEYGFKASMMAPGQMQAAERMAAECATLRARVAELEAEARVKRISAPPPPPRSRPMTEQGPTREQIEAGLRVLVPMLTSCTECDTAEGQLCFDCREWSEAAIAAVLTATDHLTRARHVREAVEGLSPDNMERLSRSLVTAYRRAADALEDRLGRADGRAVEDKTLHLRRADLLDALGGTDTTTPTPQNRP